MSQDHNTINNEDYGPIKFRPDNFTSLQKTPWAGYEIARKYKKSFFDSQTIANGVAIGESWEFSQDPGFPSSLLNGMNFIEWSHSKDKRRLFGVDARGNVRSCEILVKLLNASQPLSLQVHPKDGDKNLKPHECGKPESWLILDAEPGSGLYLGFNRSMSRDELRSIIKNNSNTKDYLQFVPVKPGDFFEIEPGVVHAIGPGVTLLEPQRLDQGRTGKTYRLWDWGRKYLPNGSVDMQLGVGRELHVEEGLDLFDPMNQYGMDYALSKMRKSTTSFSDQSKSSSSMRYYPGNPYYQVSLLELDKGDRCMLKLENAYAAFIALEGVFEMIFENQISKIFSALSWSQGESGFVPAFQKMIELENKSPTKSMCALIIPHHGQLLCEWR